MTVEQLTIYPPSRVSSIAQRTTNLLFLNEVIKDAARAAGAVVTGTLRAGIVKVTATNHSFRVSVGERANSSMNDWDLIERALEKESVRLDVVGVNVSFHTSTPARWEADRKKPLLTRHSDWFTRSKYQDTWQANVVLNYSPNSWASEGCAECRHFTANSRPSVYSSTNRYLSLNRKESRFCFSSYFEIGLRGEALRSI
jgi:hypothetical protein